MKKSIFITLGILILVLILGVWAYLFAFGAPKDADDVFARFGKNGASETPLFDTSRIDTENVTVGGRIQALKQLTTRPVAGAGFVDGGIAYVEQGTGHLYEIDLISGAETLISGTTIPSTRKAVFSSLGEHVAITMMEGDVSKTLVGTYGSDAQFSGIALPDNATQVAFGSGAGTIQYLVREDTGAVGYSSNLDRNSSTRVFSLPLRDVRVLWGNPVYVYTTPTATQSGYLYRVVKNNLTYVTKGDMGLMAFRTPQGLVLTSNTESSVITTTLLENAEKVPQALPLIPEKCVTTDTAIYCAVPKETLNIYSFPDAWYKGVVSYTDALWKIDTVSGTATMLIDFIAVSGRSIDVASIGVNTDGDQVYLINKNDNTLWLFDTTLTE